MAIVTGVVGGLPALFLYLSEREYPVSGMDLVFLILLLAALILGLALIIVLSREDGSFRKRAVLWLTLTGLLGIGVGIGWLRLWFWYAEDHYAVGDEYSFLRVGAGVSLVVTMVCALGARVLTPRLGKYALVFLLPFAAISIPWLIYEAWWDWSGLWY